MSPLIDRGAYAVPALLPIKTCADVGAVFGTIAAFVCASFVTLPSPSAVRNVGASTELSVVVLAQDGNCDVVIVPLVETFPPPAGVCQLAVDPSVERNFPDCPDWAGNEPGVWTMPRTPEYADSGASCRARTTGIQMIFFMTNP
jgi:hypothetical protein